MTNSYLKESTNIDSKKINKNNKNNIFRDAGLSMIGKKIKVNCGSGIPLTNNEIKDIIKVTLSLENRGILVKETTRKITSQEGGFLNFHKPLMTAGLPLIKYLLTPLAKTILFYKD